MPPEVQLVSDSDLESVISAQEQRPCKRRRNSTAPKYFCSIEGCEATFRRLDHLDRHEYKHTGIKRHACTYDGCDKVFSIVTHLKRHLRTTHERTAPPIPTVRCEVINCDKLFQTVQNMQRHIREVHENPKIYKCTYCEEKFTQRLKMRRHEIIKHTKKYPFNCSKCNKGFQQEWQYERHAPSCKIYPCNNCSLKFEKWTLYIKHCKETQHGRKYYKCEHCGHTFSRPSDLKNHINVHHMDDDQKVVFKCTHDGCTRSYAYRRNLKQHQRTHHTIKQFVCRRTEDCQKVFNSSQDLKKHLKVYHKREEKPIAARDRINQKQKKKRKDSRQSKLSNLVKLSGLAVDKDFDKLLRCRETTAIKEVAASLSVVQSVGEDTDETDIEMHNISVDNEKK